MATSGTFTGSRGGGSTGPYLTLAWSRIETDIAGNRSKIRLTLNLVSEYNISFSASKTGNLHGTSFTYTGNFYGPGTKTIKTQDVWVSHNADGSKSQSFSATFNIAITWGGSYVSSLSVSGTANIDTIPRASGLTAFSLSSTTLNTGTAVTINYTLDRKSSVFTHYLNLTLGNKSIKTWNVDGNGALTATLTAAEVNTIINSLPNSTSGTLKLNMQTKSGSSNIGSVASRSVNISLNANIKPSVSGLTVAIAGSGRDKTLNKYVQGISKVQASFTRSAGYGASLSSSTIVVRRQSGGSNSQTIASNSGTTANPVTLSGTYEIIATAKDSRGRSTTATTTITVHAYSAPKITRFTASRTSPTTTVSNAITATWSALGGDNAASVTVVGTTGTTNTTLYSLTGQTTGSVSATRTYTSQADTNTYTYKITVTDSFGKKADAIAVVGTSFIELTIAKGLGVGIGKIHEKGSLDVRGDAFFESEMWLTKVDTVERKLGFSNSANTPLSYLWGRDDALGLWDDVLDRGIFRYDMATKELKIQAAGGITMDTDGLKWQNLPLKNGATSWGSNYTPQYAIMAGLVFIRGAVTNLSQDIIISTLPAGARPNYIHIFTNITTTVSGATRTARWAINSNGNMEMNGVSSGGVTASHFYPINTVYPLY